MDDAERTDKEEEEKGGGGRGGGTREEKMGHFQTFAKKNNPGTDCLIISICLVRFCRGGHAIVFHIYPSWTEAEGKKRVSVGEEGWVRV